MSKLPSNLSIRKFKSPWHGQTRYVVELEEKVGDDWEQAAHLWASTEKNEPWVSVSNARIATEYRGKGLYPVMLKELRDLVQADGYKGIVSFREGRQGGMSDRSWQKFADREPRVKEMKGDYYLSALPKTGRMTSTQKLAAEWVRDTMESMIRERRLPNLGPGYTDEQRAENAIAAIIKRKTSYALTLPQSRFWREAKRQLDGRSAERVQQNQLRFEEEESGRASLRDVRKQQIEQELRQGKYKGKSGAFYDKVIASAVQSRLKEENLDGLGALPKTGRISLATAKRALKLLPPGRQACKITAANLRDGLEVEREHRDVTRLGLKKTALIAASHLCESPRYYTELKKLERRLKRSKK